MTTETQQEREGTMLRATRIGRNSVLISLVEGESQMKVDIFSAPVAKTNTEGRSNEKQILADCLNRAFEGRKHTIERIRGRK